MPVVELATLSVNIAVNATLSLSANPLLSASKVEAVLLIVLLVPRSDSEIVYADPKVSYPPPATLA